MKRLKINLGALLAIAMAMSSCDGAKKEDRIETAPISFTKEGEAFLIRSAGDTISRLDIEFAETDYERQTGLMYRNSMEKSQGMLFLYDSEARRSFYMKNTYIPLDILFYDSDSSLVSIQKNAEPRSEQSLASEGPARFILEVNAGLSDEWELEKGDRISFYKTN